MERMVVRAGLRRSLSRLAAGVAVAAAAAAAMTGAAAKEPRAIIQAPHYGDSLFYFYQERYFTSVTHLMVSQHFTRLPPHEDEAEVLRGGLFLSYGLHREAGEIFAQLIEKSTTPSVRDRAWFYLAKIRYQRGLLAEAEQSIDRIQGNLPPDLEEERGLLHANLLLARNDFARAAALLQTLAKNSKAGPYVRYNLGVALIKSGDVVGGFDLLDEVGRAPALTDEYRSLRDKANVALGFAALKEAQPERAKAYLERVRLSGMLANKALLGFGWAAQAMQDPQKALVPWLELTKRDASDAAVLEAKLAVPYAFAEAGAFGQALEQYNDTLAVFERENTNLDESIAAIRDGKLLSGLLERNPGEEMGWFWNIRELPEMPHAGHLSHVLAGHEFQEAFKNYRDLHFLARNLSHWERSLSVLRDMLANRRQAYNERLSSLRDKERADALESLQRRWAGVASELERAEEETIVEAFADPKERELAQRLERVRGIIERHGNDAEVAAARERYRRAAGALSWQLAQKFQARLWEAKKAIKDVEKLLGEGLRSDAKLIEAARNEPARFDALAARIDELEQRLHAMMPRVAELIQMQQHDVQELAVAALDHQKERLAVYTTQARFAIAQLYDRARMAKGGGATEAGADGAAKEAGNERTN
jgi:tetratricopeptide (TPR) repeat protein